MDIFGKERIRVLEREVRGLAALNERRSVDYGNLSAENSRLHKELNAPPQEERIFKVFLRDNRCVVITARSFSHDDGISFFDYTDLRRKVAHFTRSSVEYVIEVPATKPTPKTKK